MRLQTFAFLGIAAVAFSPPKLPQNPNIKQVSLHPESIIMDDQVRGSPSVNGLTISDILPRLRNINIFAALTRDIPSISDRLQSEQAASNTTLLAPLNSAVQNLPRKPWEDRPGDTSGVSAERNEDKAAQNLQKFVEEHVIPVSPWKAGKENKMRTLGGQELWWEDRQGRRVIMPGEVVVDEVVGKVGNGEIWALREVINYV